MLCFYFVGLDVFCFEFIVYGEVFKVLCVEFGFIGLYLFDNVIVLQVDGFVIVVEIYCQNIILIDLVDVVFVNVVDFCGYELDFGMCFEIGYVIVCGKDVWCYNVFDVLLVGQVLNINGNDVDGWVVEDFGLLCNFMIVCSCCFVVGNVCVCLKCMCVYYVQLDVGYKCM